MVTVEEQMEQHAPAQSAARRAPAAHKVAYIMSRFPKLSETFVLYEMAELQRQGVPVEVFPLMNERATVMHDEAKPLVERAHYMPFVSLPILRAQLHYLSTQPRQYLRLWAEVVRGTWGSANFLLGGLAFLPKAARFAYEMTQLQVTHVHAHFANHPTLAALAVHRLTGIPFSFTAHAHDIYVDRHMLAQKVRAAAFVIAISEYNRELIVKHCGEDVRSKIFVVHCGVDTGLFQPRSKPARSAVDPLRIVCVGSLEEKKGQRFLVAACEILKRRGVNFVCHLIGDGDTREALAQQIAAAGLDGVVRLEGAQPRSEVALFLQGADVVALPSIVTKSGKMEGIPVALMEPLACEVPVVSTRISGIPELVEDGVTGLLVPPADAEALADALQRLAEQPELGQRLARAGREKVLAEFDLAKNGQELALLMLGEAE